MTTIAKTTAKRVVLIGSCWRRRDPSGAWQSFEVTHFGKNLYAARIVKGRTPSGKTITCNVVAMENGDPRFEHLHDRYAKAVG
jgi:hypothetical protein